MNRLTLTIVILFIALTMACKKSSEIPSLEGRASDPGTTQLAQSSSKTSTASPASSANPFKAPPVPLSATGTAPGMNPPHGQPNHRCDIAVGAPLNSPPKSSNSAPSVTTQSNSPVQITTTPTTSSQLNAPNQTTAPGMNPPHGQFGHRCDIAVGVPLDSPPGTGKSTPPGTSQSTAPYQVTTSPSTASQPNSPVQITTTPLSTGQSNAPVQPTAPGMNPPHGQPNHRCDIAVGMPLDSPPGTGKTAPGAVASPSTSSPPIQIVPAPK